MTSKVRRACESESKKESEIRCGRLRVDLTSLRIFDGSALVELGAVEFRLLLALLRARGSLVSRSQLSEVIWGDEALSDRGLDPHISALRRKIKGAGVELRTVYGVGYSLTESPSAAGSAHV